MGQAGSALGVRSLLPRPVTQWARFPASLGSDSGGVKSRGDLRVPELQPAQKEVGSVTLVVETSAAGVMIDSSATKLPHGGFSLLFF